MLEWTTSMHIIVVVYERLIMHFNVMDIMIGNQLFFCLPVEYYKKKFLIVISLKYPNSLSARILHRAPPTRLQVDQNFLTQKIVADPKMRSHQKSFGIWRVTEAILGKKTWVFLKNIFWKKFIINHNISLIFRYAFYRY